MSSCGGGIVRSDCSMQHIIPRARIIRYVVAFAAIIGFVGAVREWARRRNQLGKQLLQEVFRDQPDRMTVVRLLGMGANPNASNSFGITALSEAATKSDPLLVRDLLRKGGDPNRADHDGWTPLTRAVIYGNHPALELLLRAGGNPDSIITVGVNPVTHRPIHTEPVLATVAEAGDDEAVILLLRSGAHLDRPTWPEGDTGLMLAVAAGHQSTARLLRRAGANPHLKNRRGISAADASAKTPFHH
jgi:ankyrin repeat protein